MKESISLSFAAFLPHQVFPEIYDVVAKIGGEYLCASRHTGQFRYFPDAEVDAVVSVAKAAAQKPEMVAGELIGFEQDTLTDRFALAIAGRMGDFNKSAEDFAKYTAPEIWSRAAALAAARPPQ